MENNVCYKCFNTDVNPHDYYDGIVSMPKCEGKCCFDGKQFGDDGWHLERHIQVEKLAKAEIETVRELRHNFSIRMENSDYMTLEELNHHSDDITHNERIVENLALHRYL